MKTVPNRTFRNVLLCSTSVAALASGCAIQARVQLSAAETLEALATQTSLAVNEYHLEIRESDRQRRLAAVDAFVARLTADRDDDIATAQHTEKLNQALDALRTDADVEYARHRAAEQNLRIIRETATGLRNLGLQSMKVSDTMRTFLTDRLDRAAQGAVPTGE